jgi:hypothetical protein
MRMASFDTFFAFYWPRLSPVADMSMMMIPASP